VRVSLRQRALVVDLGSPYRCLSSAVLGGGLSWVRTWINQQVPHDYSRTDPRDHLVECTAGLQGPVVGMLTAAQVAAYERAEHGSGRAFATVGLSHPLAAAGSRPRAVPVVGTINIFVAMSQPLSDEGLVGAMQTAVEAKAQALADAGIAALNAHGPATGTATDSVCISCLPGEGLPFAGPATRVGGDIARAVHEAVLQGALRYRQGREQSAVGR
jgi:adenosylcobinamide hydrolase